MSVHSDFQLMKGNTMNTIHLLAAALIAIAGTAHAAGGHDHAHEHKAQHGGVVTEVKDVDYELVAKPDLIQLHLRDHGKAVDVAKVSAKLTILAGSEKQEVELQPAGALLEAKGSFKVAGAKVIAVVTLPGKPQATVRFAIK
jgi:hypothetical protein